MNKGHKNALDSSVKRGGFLGCSKMAFKRLKLLSHNITLSNHILLMVCHNLLSRLDSVITFDLKSV